MPSEPLIFFYLAYKLFIYNKLIGLFLLTYGCLGTDIAYLVGKQYHFAPCGRHFKSSGPTSLARKTSHNTELKPCDAEERGRLKRSQQTEKTGDAQIAHKNDKKVPNESKAAAKSRWFYLDGIDDFYSSDHGVDHNRISGHCWDP